MKYFYEMVDPDYNENSDFEISVLVWSTSMLQSWFFLSLIFKPMHTSGITLCVDNERRSDIVNIILMTP